MFKQVFTLCMAFVLAHAGHLSANNVNNAKAEWCSHTFSAMTTRVSIEFFCLEDLPLNESLVRAIEREFDRLNTKLNRYDPDSMLSKLNHSAGQHAVAADGELMRLLVASQRMAMMTEGAFDITFGSTGYLYDFRASVQPQAEQLAKSGVISYQNILLDFQKSEVRFSHPDVLLDLGGIAKGYAVDQAISLLQGAGVKHARITAGGDTRLIGDKAGYPWVIAIKHPRAPEKHAVKLPLSDIAISTSGDYERYFINEAGERVHHILSPQSGKPVKGVMSVTILAPTAMQSDALSTGVFVMGPEKGLALINRLPDVDAIIIDDNLKMHYSDGLMVP